MGDAINEDTRPRAPVVRALANPALTSKTSLNSPAPIHRRNSLVDPERRALAVPKPRARSRMPTVRIINGIECGTTTQDARVALYRQFCAAFGINTSGTLRC